jgi:hypothetical protein
MKKKFLLLASVLLASNAALAADKLEKKSQHIVVEREIYDNHNRYGEPRYVGSEREVYDDHNPFRNPVLVSREREYNDHHGYGYQPKQKYNRHNRYNNRGYYARPRYMSSNDALKLITIGAATYLILDGMND